MIKEIEGLEDLDGLTDEQLEELAECGDSGEIESLSCFFCGALLELGADEEVLPESWELIQLDEVEGESDEVEPIMVLACPECLAKTVES